MVTRILCHERGPSNGGSRMYETCVLSLEYENDGTPFLTGPCGHIYKRGKRGGRDVSFYASFNNRERVFWYIFVDVAICLVYVHAYIPQYSIPDDPRGRTLL